MDKHRITGQLKQLLRSGYSIDDVRSMAIGPRALVEQAILDYQAQREQRAKTQRTLSHQATFAMYLGAR